MADTFVEASWDVGGRAYFPLTAAAAAVIFAQATTRWLRRERHTKVQLEPELTKDTLCVRHVLLLSSNFRFLKISKSGHCRDRARVGLCRIHKHIYLIIIPNRTNQTTHGVCDLSSGAKIPTTYFPDRLPTQAQQLWREMVT